MSVAQKLVKSILSCSKIVYYSDNIERKTLDGERILAPFLGVIGKDETISLFAIRDDGVACTNLVIHEIGQDVLPEELTSFDIFMPSAQFDGPVHEVYDNYKVGSDLIRQFASVEFFDQGARCKVSVSQDAPTLFEITVG